ncbi:MAG TPA: hypothetical protein VHZ51_19445 [Ktedonobacteraceae bacterium]|jgi:hypothetical protein|nr:hypothetical protein [Ktedonobacteraceae bacterium]
MSQFKEPTVSTNNFETQDLTDEQLAQVTGGAGLLSSVTGTGTGLLSSVTGGGLLNTVTGTTSSLLSSASVNTGVGANAQVGPVSLGLGAGVNVRG